LVFSLSATTILKPKHTLRAFGPVNDFVYNGHKLYVATSNGSVEIFDTKKYKKIKSIKLPKIKDFMGDDIYAKIYSVDYLNGDILFVSQGNKGYREIWIYNKKLSKIIGIDKKLFIRKARFIDKRHILIALLSNQVILLDLKNSNFIYNIQANASSFSDFVLNDKKDRFYLTDESGIVREFETKSGKETKIVGSKNLDKVFQLDYKNGVIITAGQDRKSVVYSKYSSYELMFGFLLYSCALSPSAKMGAIAFNEQNEVLVFDVNTKSKKFILRGQDSTLTKIIFVNEKEIWTSSDSKNINYWRIK
jgi:hypothetical protein